MRWLIPFVMLGSFACGSDTAVLPSEDITTPVPGNESPSPSSPLVARTLATGQNTPWDLQMGPDGELWVSERRGVISRIDTSNAEVTAIKTLEDVREVSESGLLGLALHSSFSTDPFVYAFYSFDNGPGIRNRLILRMRWDGVSLSDPETLLTDIPGTNNHNGSRLAFGPDGMLYVTTGDALNVSLPQSTASLAGKILRLTPEGLPAPANPFQNEVYSFGHRNPQGMVFHPGTGQLYVTEHGPSDNDEVNRIQEGRNYGWPGVHGFCDKDITGLNETDFCAANNVAEPLITWTPTIAPSGMDFYGSNLISEWKESLLFTSLRGASLYRLPLSSDGTAVLGQEILYAGEFGRLRDVLVGPRGEVYLATSNRDGRGSPASLDDRIILITC